MSRVEEAGAMEIQGRKVDPGKPRRKKTSILLITTLFLLTSLLLSCDGGVGYEGVGFGIFLVDNDELVLSEQHIQKYCKDTHKIVLNEEGIEKWNSYMTYTVLPQLAGTLNEEEFFVMVEGEEAYRGHFSSFVVSSIPPGVTIVDTLIKLDSERFDSIQISRGFPPFGSDPRENQDIFDFFEERGMLDRATPCGSTVW